MAWPTKLEEAFNLGSPIVQAWEVEQIREAARTRRMEVSPHALERALSRTLTTADMLSIILNGEPVEKDLPQHGTVRKPGISFVGTGPNGIRAKVKVTLWVPLSYEVVTIHQVEGQA